MPIRSRIDTGYPDSPILFERLLGRRWAMLPASVRAVHGGREASASGRAVALIGKKPARANDATHHGASRLRQARRDRRDHFGSER